MQRTQSFLSKYRPQRRCCGTGVPQQWSVQHRSIRAAEISYYSLDGAKSKGPSMSIKFEGEPPFYLGIAETRRERGVTRPKSVSVRFIIATDVAKALAEQLPIAVRMAELQKQQGR